MSAREDYLGRVQATAWAVADLIPSSARLDQANRLIEHGEPAEGLGYLAWAIVESGTTVPARLIEAIRSDSRDLVDEADLPPNLDDYGDPDR